MINVNIPIQYAASISGAGISKRVSALGNNPQIDTATVPEDIWTGATLGVLNAIDHKFVQRLTTPTNLEIVSSSASDTALGVGARTVSVLYLDADWKQKTVTMTLNGTTPVALPEPVIRVNTILVTSSGSTTGGANVGNISVRVAGGLGATISYMLAGQGADRSSLYTCPEGCQLDVMAVLISVNSIDVNTRLASIDLCFSINNGPIIRPAQISNSSATPYRHEVANAPILTVNPRTDLWIRCTGVNNNNTDLTASIAGIQRVFFPVQI